MKKNKAGNCLIYIGFLFVVAAIILTSYNFWDDRRAAAASGAAMEEILLDISNAKEMQEEETPDYFVAPEMEMPKSSVGEYDYIGVLDIPALGMNLPVVGELSYSALKVAPCRYTGSAYQDDLIIAAHNYSGHFGKIKRLQAGDDVFFTDMDGNLFSYQMVSMEVLKDTAVKDMRSGGYDLTLFTCTYAGDSRMPIRCERNPI